MVRTLGRPAGLLGPPLGGCRGAARAPPGREATAVGATVEEALGQPREGAQGEGTGEDAGEDAGGGTRFAHPAQRKGCVRLTGGHYLTACMFAPPALPVETAHYRSHAYPHTNRQTITPSYRLELITSFPFIWFIGAIW